MAQGYYDNYNYDDDSKYSKYTTTVNKYKCQKGLFEGFLVSSVEFCKNTLLKLFWVPINRANK